MVVAATKSERAVTELPVAVTVVSPDGIDRGLGPDLQDALAGVPGVTVEKRSENADDLVLVVRGSGARAAFGVRDVLVLVDGVPLTDLDGQSRLESVEPGAIERIEVLRGPAAGLHGGGADGGAVNFVTRQAPPGVSGGGSRTEGSFGLERTAGSAGGDGFGSNGWVAGSYTHAGGWRRHAAFSGGRFTGQATLSPAPDTRLHLLALGSSVDLLRPGPITAAQLAEDPAQARAANVTGDWDRHEGRLKLAAEAAVGVGQGLRATALLHGDARLLTQANFQWATSRRFAGGADVRVRWDTCLGSREAALTAGGAAGWHRLDEQDYKNAAGSRGTLAADEGTLIRTRAAYLQGEFRALPTLTVLGHARWDRHAVGLADRYVADGDQSGGRTWGAWSPALGASLRLAPALSVYANAASGYAIPALTELRSPLSGTRFDLDPARSRSVEVGVRGTPWPAAWAECAVYAERVSGEIARQTVANAPFYRNIARTDHRGVETGLTQRLPWGLSVSADATLADARFRDDPVFADHRLPGVPPAEASAELRWSGGGPWAAAAGRWRRHVFADDANTVRAASFRTVGVRAGWRTRMAEVAAGVDNLTDARYAAALVVNDAAGNDFEPGEPRNFWGRIAVVF